MGRLKLKFSPIAIEAGAPTDLDSLEKASPFFFGINSAQLC